MPDQIEIVVVDWQHSEAELSAIRSQVFVVEQHVPAALEWDQKDAGAVHVLARHPKYGPVACARLLRTGQIGRMAVLQAFRRRGIGRAMLDFLLQYAAQQGFDEVFLHAQISARVFYAGAGFIARGDVYEEAGIPHISMFKQLL